MVTLTKQQGKKGNVIVIYLMSITRGVLGQSPEPEAHEKVLKKNKTRSGEYRDGTVVEHLPPTQASHQCGPGSIPGLGVICGPVSLLLVLVLAPRGFSPGTPVFPSPQKPTFPNSNSIWIIVKHFIMSLWLGRLRKHSPCSQSCYERLRISFKN